MRYLYLAITTVLLSAFSGTVGSDKCIANTDMLKSEIQISDAQDIPQSLYAIDSVRNAIYQFSISKSGILKEFSQPALATGGAPSSISTTPNGRFVYVGNRDGKSISQYSVGADGSLAYAHYSGPLCQDSGLGFFKV